MPIHWPKSRNYLTMGVINLTPDSFSDGGFYFNRDPSSLLDALMKFKSLGVEIPDVGAQSTAPSSPRIEAQEELARLRLHLFGLIENKLWPWDCLSLDTFRVQTAALVFELWRKHYPQGQFIFNDVSGLLDDDLRCFMKAVGRSPVSYIYTSTNIAKRELVPQHMKYAQSELSGQAIAGQVGEDFARAKKWFQKLNLGQSQLIVDPGFGFSKTRAQNLYLLNHVDVWERPLAQGIPILWGISRKSFLRPEGKSLRDHPELIASAEELHRQHSLRVLSQYANRHFFWRLHDPLLAHS